MVVKTKKAFFIFGYGYVARFLCHELGKLGWKIYATSRTVEKHTSQCPKHVHLIDFNDTARIHAKLSESEVILITAPPHEEEGDPVLSRFKPQLIAACPTFRWIGYLSSTGVYGDHHGQWVDETSSSLPHCARAQRRLDAEQAWLEIYQDYQLPVHLFRLSGIYGPGRNALEKIQSGKDYTIVKPGQFFSRTHVQDICLALIASMQEPTPGEYYNISDDLPAPLHEVDQYAAQLLNVTLRSIPYEQSTLSPMAKEFFSTNKKVSGQKIKQRLKIQWQYPDYREGLREGCIQN